jgi:DNA invertase Pin-like site-specific DNA recombinase
MTDCVYVLINPIDLKPFYVGRTNNPKNRLTEHIREAKQGIRNIVKSRLIMSIIERGIKPIIRIIEWCFDSNSGEREKYWIKYYNKLTNLVNATDGGEMGSKYGGGINQKLATRILTLEQAKTIFDLFVYTTLSYNDLSKLYNVSSATIKAVMGSMGGKAWNEINNGVRHYSLFNQKQKRENGLRTSNTKRGNHVKLNYEKIEEIKVMREKGFSLSKIAKIYDIDSSTVSVIVNGKRWKDTRVTNNNLEKQNDKRKSFWEYTKLDDDQIRSVFNMKNDDKSLSYIADQFDTSYFFIQRILSREIYSYVTI